MEFLNEEAKKKYNIISKLRDAQQGIENTIDEIADVSFDERIPQGQLMWECPKSPFGTCKYHHFEDPAWDECLYCGQPYERK